jgi:hypothetical protein
MVTANTHRLRDQRLGRTPVMTVLRAGSIGVFGVMRQLGGA